MKFLNLTAKAYSRTSADNMYVLEMAKSFTRKFGDDFLLYVCYCDNDRLDNVNYKSFQFKFRLSKIKFLFYWLPYIFYFFYTPIVFIFKKKYKKDVICFTNDTNILLLLIFWRKVLRFKYKVCSDWHMLSNNFKDKFISKNSDYLITTSSKLKKKILDLSGMDDEKILVAYGGIRIDEYKSINKEDVRKILSLPEDKKIVSYIGLYRTIGMEKGISTMIKSLQYFSSDIVMMFVGGRGDEIEFYKKQAEKLNVLNRCIFVEMVDFNKVVQYEQASDILAIPYPDKPHFRQYGFPMKVYEYMTSKRPILYSRLELVEEVIDDCAFGFKADDEKDFANQVKYILENSELSTKKSQKAYEKVKNYTWDKRAEKIINFLN